MSNPLALDDWNPNLEDWKEAERSLMEAGVPDLTCVIDGRAYRWIGEEWVEVVDDEPTA